MGLDAQVRCNCAKEGKTKPFPFPGRLLFDQCGNPFLADSNGKPAEGLTELQVFDRWATEPGCIHQGIMIDVRIGNISSAGHIRHWVQAMQTEARRRFPILLGKVLYSGTHAGDCLKPSEAEPLIQEAQALETLIQDEYQREFVRTIKQLCEASMATGNPIAF